jgi:hypothetical protein
MSLWGGICATTNMMQAAMNMFRPWSTKRVPWSKPDEYMMSKPAHASTKTAKAKGPSNPSNKCRNRDHQLGFSITSDMLQLSFASPKNAGFP